MEVFKLFGSVFVKTDEAQASLQKMDSKTEKVGATLKKGITIAGKVGASLAAGAAVAVGALLKIDEATKETRENLAKINTAFQASGKDAQSAGKAYTSMWGSLSASDQAQEATQLLAQRAKSEEDVASWSTIATGVVGTFGDSLPIESLIEASNETAKVGQVTGALADALNWVGLSEEEFNQKLASCSSEQERAALITETLTGAYGEAAEIYRENNDTMIKANEATAQFQTALAALGGVVGDIKNQLAGEVLPLISQIIEAFVALTKGEEGASEQLSASVNQMIDKIVEKLPEFLKFGIEIITAILKGIMQSVPHLLKSLPGLVIEMGSALLKARVSLLETGVELFGQLWEGIKSVWNNIKSWVDEKVDWLIDKVTFWDNKKSEMDDDDESSTPEKQVHGRHASGLRFVPYDGYKAELHRGETVMNANDTGTLLTAIAGLLASQKQSSGSQKVELVVNLDGRAIARQLYDPLQDETKMRGHNLAMA